MICFVKRANLELELETLPASISYGARVNDSWSGFLGYIDSGFVDTVAIDFTPSTDRSDDFFFTPPYFVGNEAVTVSSGV